VMEKEIIEPTAFHMPAEWQQQEGVWFQWPHDNQWPMYAVKLEGTWLRLTELCKSVQMVHIIVPDERRRDHVAHELSFHGIGTDNVDFHIIPTNDIWCRDNGPTFVVDDKNRLAAVSWVFTGWGGRYDHEMDNQVPGRIARELGIPCFQNDLVIEGGNIESNGKGTIMLTRSAVINDNRNPGMTERDVEGCLRRYLGATNFVWLTGMKTEDVETTGWSDDTDTHIDTVARFVDDHTVVASLPDEDDPQYRMLQTHLAEFKEQKLENGAAIDVVTLPMPKSGYYSTSQIGGGGNIMEVSHALPTDASYTNFLIANGLVLVPTYGNINDDRAIAILREVFPQSEVIGVFAGMVAENGGEFHCISQQQPAGAVGWMK